MNDKFVGVVMIISSLGVMVFMFIWTIILPLLDEQFLFKAYMAIAIVLFIAIFILTMLTVWIGFNFLKNRAPKEDISEQIIEN
jgi:membrane protein implicated in regulation of membrane protease activity